MKKIFYFIVATCLMTACVASEEGKTFTIQSTNQYIYLKNYGAFDLYKFTYENHDYILLKGIEQVALEHDPNCQCHYDF